MSGIYPSTPPPAHLVRPQLCKCRPEKDARRRKTAIWFRQWTAEHGITTRTLVALGFGAKGVVDEIIAGRKSIHFDDIWVIPRRYRAAFVTDYLTFLASIQPDDADDSTPHLRHG